MGVHIIEVSVMRGSMVLLKRIENLRHTYLVGKSWDNKRLNPDVRNCYSNYSKDHNSVPQDRVLVQESP